MSTQKKQSSKDTFGIAHETSKEDSSATIERTDVKDTPFTIVKTEEAIFGVMGQYRITEKCKTVEACKKEVKKITWNRVVQVIMVLQEHKERLKQEIEA